METAGFQDAAEPRDHGGGLDAAIAEFGGTRRGWCDLSTGINPISYPVPILPKDCWQALPDRRAVGDLEVAARKFWRVPDQAALLVVSGASAAIAQIPRLLAPEMVSIRAPTYNEHAAAFAAAGWTFGDDATALVAVHPNNPDGRRWTPEEVSAKRLTIIDESFCDICPEASLIDSSVSPGVIVLKSFGKFWGLAGLRLGFVIGDPMLVADLSARLGPWPVSGPALTIGAIALTDEAWATETRARLNADAMRLDALLIRRGAALQGGTSLFRLYEVEDAAAWQVRLAKAHIWSRIFPYSKTWLRLGLPGTEDHWSRLEAAL